MAEVVSDPSAPVDAVLVSDSWWISDPLDPEATTRVVSVRPGWSPTHRVAAGVHRPAGSDVATVVHGDRGGIYGNLPVRILNPGEYDELVALLTAGRTLLLRSSVGGRSWYIAVTGDVGGPLLRAQPERGQPYPLRDAWELEVPFAEVDPV